jgi:hypothetical protein
VALRFADSESLLKGTDMTGESETATCSPAFPDGRGSGRTQWMLDRVVESVVAGQPYSVIVTHRMWFADDLRRRLVEMLRAVGLDPEQNRGRLLADGSVIEFVSRSQIDQWRRGRCGYGEFWDHFASGID